MQGIILLDWTRIQMPCLPFLTLKKWLDQTLQENYTIAYVFVIVHIILFFPFMFQNILNEEVKGVKFLLILILFYFVSIYWLFKISNEFFPAKPKLRCAKFAIRLKYFY